MKPNRRHLLKGSLAAPLVLTVRSAAGHGMAMSSAAMCRVHDADRAKDDDIHKFRKHARDDRWLRREMQICRLEKKDHKGDYEVLSDEEYYRDDDGCYCQLVKRGDDYDVIRKDDYRPPKVRVHKNLRKEYGLVCVDDRGEVKGWAWDHKDHHPITGSCWSSLKIT